jgi:hypothetical protein
LQLHASSIKYAVLIPFLLCSLSSWATDIQCGGTQQPARRVICDHAILNHEYDNIYEQQQKLIQEGKLTPSDLAAWQHKRDACIDVHCIDGVFAQWNAIETSLENGAGTPTITASDALGTPVITASEALGTPLITASEALGTPVITASDALGTPVITASEALGTPLITASEALGTPVITASEAQGTAPASAVPSVAADANQQSSGVPVSRQGSAYGVALPQSVASDKSAPGPVSATSASTAISNRASLNVLPNVLGVLLAIAILSVGATFLLRRRRQR